MLFLCMFLFRTLGIFTIKANKHNKQTSTTHKIQQCKSQERRFIKYFPIIIGNKKLTCAIMNSVNCTMVWLKICTIYI